MKKITEPATRGVLQKKAFLKISQNSQENTCARVSFLIKFYFFKNTFLRPIKKTWYDWLINYIPESVTKIVGGFKKKIVRFFN